MFLRTLRINLRTQKQGKKFEEMQTDRRLASLILDRLIIGPIFPWLLLHIIFIFSVSSFGENRKFPEIFSSRSFVTN